MYIHARPCSAHGDPQAAVTPENHKHTRKQGPPPNRGTEGLEIHFVHKPLKTGLQLADNRCLRLSDTQLAGDVDGRVPGKGMPAWPHPKDV